MHYGLRIFVRTWRKDGKCVGKLPPLPLSVSIKMTKSRWSPQFFPRLSLAYSKEEPMAVRAEQTPPAPRFWYRLEDRNQEKPCSWEWHTGKTPNPFAAFHCSQASWGARGRSGAGTAAGWARCGVCCAATASPPAPTGSRGATDRRCQPPPEPRQGHPCPAAASCLGRRGAAAPWQLPPASSRERVGRSGMRGGKGPGLLLAGGAT